MNIKSLLDLYNHMEWADARAWSAIFESETGQTNKEISEIFYHIHLVQYAFLRMWSNESDMSFPEFDDSTSLMKWGKTFHNDMATYLEKLNEAQLTEELPLPPVWLKMVEQQLGQMPEKITQTETMLQLVLHTAHHRGQINACLRKINFDPPTVDYITWIWLGRPAVHWAVVC